MELLFLSLFSLALLLIWVPYVYRLCGVVTPSNSLHCHRDVNVPVHELRWEQRLYYFLLCPSRGRLHVYRP